MSEVFGGAVCICDSHHIQKGWSHCVTSMHQKYIMVGEGMHPRCQEFPDKRLTLSLEPSLQS